MRALAAEITADPGAVRALRFALGVTIAVALAYGIEWPLSFLLPVLTAVILGLPLPMPSLAAGLRNMLYTLAAFGIGLAFSLFFLRYPLVYLLVLGLVLFHLYYYLNRGGSFWLTLMSMLAILMLPMLANTHEGLASGLALGFVGTSWLTMLMIWLAHLLVPDPAAARMPKPPGFQAGYSKPAAQLALKSTLVIWPLASLFIVFDLMDYLLVMIFSALFILKPELSKGKEAGLNSLVPEFHFYIVLTLFTALVFGINIFSAKPSARYFGSAFVALLILVNGSMGEGAEFTQLFAQRIALIVLAVLYIVAVLKVLDNYWPAKVRDPE
jgi:hypothetical protein